MIFVDLTEPLKSQSIHPSDAHRIVCFVGCCQAFPWHRDKNRHVISPANHCVGFVMELPCEDFGTFAGAIHS